MTSTVTTVYMPFALTEIGTAKARSDTADTFTPALIAASRTGLASPVAGAIAEAT